MKKFIKLLCIFIWLSFIFYMSNQTGTSSGEMSDEIFSSLLHIFPAIASYKMVVVMLIRKGAHIFEYFILSLLLYTFLLECQNKKKCLLTGMFCFLFASLDEIHQMFIPGRSGVASDVLVDMGGFLLFFICIQAVKKIDGKSDKYRNEK